MGALLQDLRYTFRILAHSPGYTLAALITLALGIGANTTIFSVVNQVLLQPLPYREPDQLVMIWGKNPALGSEMDLVSPADFADMDARNHVFEGMAASRDAGYSLTGEGDPETITAYRFSNDFFDLMGVAPALGRTFLPEEDRPGAPRVVVLSDLLWRRRFHADPSVLSETITLSDEPYTIIGVMPPTFRHPEHTELWTPLALDPASMGDRNNRFLRVMARLRHGVALSAAAREMEAIAARLQAEHPSTNAGQGVTIVPLRTMYVGDIQPALLALSGAVGFVLLIACANVSNLTLARASARRREIAIRLAVGAGRARVTRQLLTESVVLSLLGGALGLLLAVWGAGLMVAIFPNNIANLSIPRVEEIPIDGRALLFGLAISLLSGVLSGLAPALQAGGSDLSRALKETQGRTEQSAWAEPGCAGSWSSRRSRSPWFC